LEPPSKYPTATFTTKYSKLARSPGKPHTKLLGQGAKTIKVKLMSEQAVEGDWGGGLRVIGKTGKAENLKSRRRLDGGDQIMTRSWCIHILMADSSASTGLSPRGNLKSSGECRDSVRFWVVNFGWVAQGIPPRVVNNSLTAQGH